MNNHSRKFRKPLNTPSDGNGRQQIDEMSALEVAEAFECFMTEMDEDSFDPDLIDIYLDALDQKAPMPEMPSKEDAYANFQKRMFLATPKTISKVASSGRRFQRIKRVGLIAVISVICMLGIMMIAQAAGVDVWGTMASWTNEIFSFGTIRSEGATDRNYEADYTSLEEALFQNQIAEVGAPTWIPEGYTLDNVKTTYSASMELLFLDAEYSDGENVLNMSITSYDGVPNVQVEKTDAPVESFEMGDSKVYLIENNNNNTAIWVTAHYECVVVGVVDKNILRQVVQSTQGI